VGGWDGISGRPSQIALGNVYQFKAVVEDNIGNKGDTNIIELLVVDRVAEADIAEITRIDGLNSDEMHLLAHMINDMLNPPRLTGRVRLWGYTDADVVGTTFLYRPKGADPWIEIEATLNTWFGAGEFANSDPWDRAEWLTDGRDNDGDWVDTDGDGIQDPGEPGIDEPGESGFHYAGQQTWDVVWDTTTINGLYEIAVVANTGDDKAMAGLDTGVTSIMTVYIDHNAYDITDSIEDWTPTDGAWVGGRTRRPVEAQNPKLYPDDKEPYDPRGEVDVCVVFPDGIPADLDMGIPTGC
jgi:hypothetical protein